MGSNLPVLNILYCSLVPWRKGILSNCYCSTHEKWLPILQLLESSSKWDLLLGVHHEHDVGFKRSSAY